MTAPALSARQGSADYLTEICRLLWPPPASAELLSRRSAKGSAGSGTGGRELLVLPSAGRPKLIVPAGRRAAAAAVRRYGEPASVKAKLATRALAILLAGGLRPVLGDRLVMSVPEGCETVGSYLAELIGRPGSIDVGLHVGAPRANRKPVVQLLTPGGDTIGFAKIGINPLTADLVRREHVALKRLAQVKLTALRPPAVLGHGTWNGLEVLALDALPTWLGRTKLTEARLAAAMVEVAGSAGLSSATLPDSGYLAGLLDRLARAADDGGPDAEPSAALRALINRLADAAGASSLAFGCWHGDLTPWNLACTSAGLLVWDWERFAVGVPVGFDALHYWLQSRVVRPRCDPVAAAVRCIDVAPELLAPFDLSPAQARLTALAYLSELSVRYIADRQADAGARLGAPGRWLIPAIESGVGAL
jgi:hypothetical protein